VRVEIGITTPVVFDVDPEGFRGFSYDRICDELRRLARNDGSGDPVDSDIEYWADKIEEALGAQDPEIW
jgi:hypothetical protein